MNETGLYDDDWLDLEWSPWLSLDRADGDLGTISSDPGLYRVRHQDQDGVEYIGETGRSTRGRVGSLARGTYAEEMPYRDPHTAAPCLWTVRDRYGPEFEVSYAVPPAAEDKQERKAIEAALIAIARREMGESPTANFGRIIDGYKQSSYNGDGMIGGPLSEGETEPNTEDGRKPVPWENVDDVIGPNWMGLEWSKPYYLEKRLAADPPDNGLYRIWYEPNSPPLAYIGESINIPSRLYKHEKTFGSDALFSYVDRPELDAAHKRQEIETDLIGAHYVEVGEAPIAQFGHEEQLPE